ncbi:monocarboxylate transporter 9-like [Mizuhopecten yessoensis]|uniref:monocarboxylate transporter 9-like n=1 Tax=Mizuhopecten yessoensis TaxID=6573 RepID=UPI000B45DE0D|nr:monocarboxylate transporter 9-like [Mizuhopecten yessoensis]
MLCILWSSFIDIKGPVSAALINRFDCRRVAIADGVVSSVGLFLSTFSPNLDVMILLYGVVGGFGIGLVYMASLVIVSYYFDKRRALATGIATCGSGVGSFVFAPVYEFLLETYGWRGAIWIVAGIMFNCVLFAIIYRPLTTHGRETSSTGYVGTLNDENNTENTTSDTDVRFKSQISQCIAKTQKLAQLLDVSLFTNAGFDLFLLSSCIVAMGSQVPYNFLPASVLEKGLYETDGALLISVLGIATTLSMVIVGLVADYPWADSLIVGGVATCFLPYYNDFSSLAIYSVIMGIPLGMCLSLPTIIVLEFLELERLPSAFGLLTFFMGISTIIGPPIAGFLEDMTESYSAAFYFAGATFVLGGITCLPIRLLIKCNSPVLDTDVPTADVVEMTHL